MTLSAHWEYLTNDFACNPSSRRNRGRANTERLRGILKERCKINHSSPQYQVDHFEFYTCLCNFKHPLMSFYLTLLDKYDNTSPWEVLDQPAQLIEALELLSRLKQETIRKEQEKQQKANARKRRRR